MKYLPISNWLTELGLAKYCTHFEQYDGIEVRIGVFFNKILEKMSSKVI